MFVERETGFEPATSTLARLHSTTELLPRGVKGFIGDSACAVNRKKRAGGDFFRFPFRERDFCLRRAGTYGAEGYSGTEAWGGMCLLAARRSGGDACVHLAAERLDSPTLGEAFFRPVRSARQGMFLLCVFQGRGLAAALLLPA